MSICAGSKGQLEPRECSHIRRKIHSPTDAEAHQGREGPEGDSNTHRELYLILWRVLRETVTYTENFIWFCEEQEPFSSRSDNDSAELSLKREQVKSPSLSPDRGCSSIEGNAPILALLYIKENFSAMGFILLTCWEVTENVAYFCSFPYYNQVFVLVRNFRLTARALYS